MKYLPCILFLLIMADMIAQDTQNDSITRLDEVVLTQDAIPKKATGITVSSKTGHGGQNPLWYQQVANVF